MDAHVDQRSNGLNLVRLVLASTVIFWHSYPLTGHDFPSDLLHQFAGQFGVDGFFAISGFLLVSSWLHNPGVVRYFKNRICVFFLGSGCVWHPPLSWSRHCR